MTATFYAVKDTNKNLFYTASKEWGGMENAKLCSTKSGATQCKTAAVKRSVTVRSRIEDTENTLVYWDSKQWPKNPEKDIEVVEVEITEK